MSEAPASPIEQAIDLHTGSNGGVSNNIAGDSIPITSSLANTVSLIARVTATAAAVNNSDESTDTTSSTGSNDALSMEVNFNADNLDMQCPATPQLHFKLPDPTTSESDNDNDELLVENISGDALAGPVGGGTRSTSPPPNCAICLGKCKNKCFTDSCMHQFCFKCLCEWSKVKPECPLCKQGFKSIIHNVKSLHQFEEYHVQPPTVQIPQRPLLTYGHMHYLNVGRNNLEIQVNDWDHPRNSRIYRSERLTLFRNPIRNEVASGVGGNVLSPDDNHGNDVASGNGANNIILNPFDHRNELLQMYRQEYPHETISSTALSNLWRRYVYDRNLYPMPLCDIMGRFRDSSPRFYRDNPAQVDRLIPWVHRDLTCLLRNTSHDVMAVLDRIKDGLFCFNILSPTFRRRLQPCLGSRTQHFIQELYNFSRSPYDLIGYDRVVQYLPESPESLVIEFSSSSDEDSLNAGGEPDNAIGGGEGASGGGNNGGNGNNGGFNSAGGGHHRAHRNRHRHNSRVPNPFNDYRLHPRTTNTSIRANQPLGNHLLSFTISTTTEGDEAPGVTVAVTGPGTQSTAINLTTRNRANEVVIDLDDSEVVDVSGTGDSNLVSSVTNAGATATSSRPTDSTGQNTQKPTHTENIELSSGSSDECEFVLERKPPHLRTPELVSLNSETDSDVIFIAESTVSTARNNAHDGGNDESTLVKNKQKTAANYEKNNSRSMNEHEEFNVGASTSAGVRSSARLRKSGTSEIDLWNNRLNRPRHDSQRRSHSSRHKSVRKARGKRLRSSSSKDDSSDVDLDFSSTDSSSSGESYQRKARKLTEVFRKKNKSRLTHSDRKESKTKVSNRKRRGGKALQNYLKKQKVSVPRIVGNDDESDDENLEELKKRMEKEKCNDPSRGESSTALGDDMKTEIDAHSENNNKKKKKKRQHSQTPNRYTDYMDYLVRQGKQSEFYGTYVDFHDNDNDDDDDKDKDDDDEKDIDTTEVGCNLPRSRQQFATEQPDIDTAHDKEDDDDDEKDIDTAQDDEEHDMFDRNSSVFSSINYQLDNNDIGGETQNDDSYSMAPDAFVVAQLETTDHERNTPSNSSPISVTKLSSASSSSSSNSNSSCSSSSSGSGSNKTNKNKNNNSSNNNNNTNNILSPSSSTTVWSSPVSRISPTREIRTPTPSVLPSIQDIDDYLLDLEQDAEDLRQAAISFLADIEVDRSPVNNAVAQTSGNAGSRDNERGDNTNDRNDNGNSNTTVNSGDI